MCDCVMQEIKAAIVDLAKRAPGLSRDNEHYILGMLNVRLFILLEYFFGKGADSAEVAQMMTDIFEDNIWPHLQVKYQAEASSSI